MSLFRLLYFSENLLDPSDGPVLGQLRDVLSASNRNNKTCGITGALVFDNQWFLQALEGERDDVWKTLRRIENDERHANVVIVQAGQVDQRLFGNWWMGLATLNEQTADAFAPYLRNGMLQPDRMSANDVLKLMTALCKTGLSRKLSSAA